MSIDNFDLLGSKMRTAVYPERFYHINIIRRHKDNPEMDSTSRLIRSYYVNNKKELDKYKGEIITLCEATGARAYINMSYKSYFEMALYASKTLTERIYNSNVDKIHRLMESAASSIKGINPAWVVDIDEDEIEESMEDVAAHITNHCGINEDPIQYIVPTVHGFHLITNPFNTSLFHTVFPNVTVDKNRFTLLYYPNSVSNE